MSVNPFNEKKKWLESFLEETKKQLDLIQSEDAKGFLESVEKCNQVIKFIDELDEKASHHYTEEQMKETKDLFSEIVELRKCLSEIIPEFQEKIQQMLKNEQKKSTLIKGYGQKESLSLSIFFDKKK